MKYPWKLYLSGIVFLLIAGCAYGIDTPVLVKSGVDRHRITIGDRLRYTISVEKDRSLDLEPIDPSIGLGQFEIKNYEAKKPKRKAGKEIYEYEYTITTFSTGDRIIPPIKISYRDQKGNTGTIWTDTISVFVESVNLDDTYADIKDIKPPLSLKSRLFVYILCVLAGAGILLYFLWQKRKKKGIFEEVREPEKSPYELAIERLKKLKEMELVLRGEIKQHYIILSEIIRRYVDGRYSIPAIERTTQELYQEMRLAGIERKYCAMIKELLDQCDLVKFAKFIPERKEIDSDLARAYEIIETTRTKESLQDSQVSTSDD